MRLAATEVSTDQKVGTGGIQSEDCAVYLIDINNKVYVVLAD